MSSLVSAEAKPYSYVFIPCNPREPCEQLIGDGSGGLQSDDLILNARKYFSSHASSSSGAQSSSQRAQMASSIRSQAISNGASAQHVGAMSDDALLSLSDSTSCEITAVTVPCAASGFRAVSMYSDDKGRLKNLPYNERATNLAKAAGHLDMSLFGDAFVGRCVDDENGDVWERVDFPIEDIDNAKKWAALGGGKTPEGDKASRDMFPGAQHMGRPVEAVQQADKSVEGWEGVTWAQTGDEVEFKIVIPEGTKAKDAAVKFGAKSIKVAVGGAVRVEGTLGGNVIIDDCTYTLQDGEGLEPGQRLLVVTMGKRAGGDNWQSPLSK